MATTTAEIFDIMTGHALHKPVMVERTLEFLRPVSGDYLDATVGYGGHAEAILEAGGDDARLIGIDRDTEALEFTRWPAHAVRGTGPLGQRELLEPRGHLGRPWNPGNRRRPL